jgi:EAL and modified HD-GYP domain-containing signal transduction protein
MPHPALTLELDSASVVDARGMAMVLKLHQAGFQLAIRGRPLITLPDQLLRCFQYCVLDRAEDRRRNASVKPAPGIERRIPFKLTGIASVQDLEAAFERGAQALVGWPIDDLPGQSGKALQTNLQSVTEAMRQVDRNAAPAQIEEAMRSDPTLTYRLLKYINSAGFGLLSEARSIREAVMMLGYAPLKRWLAVLLATSVKDSNRIPVAYASLRRGLFLEGLVDRKADATMADELFMLGIFSLMDRLMGQPREELFADIALAEPVAEALLKGTGSYADYLLIAERHESTHPHNLADLLDAHFITQGRCNQALLQALLQAHELEVKAGGH